MSCLQEKWEQIHHRLSVLDFSDQEEEAELLMEAYDNLVLAYQESRALNDEMESLLQDTLPL